METSVTKIFRFDAAHYLPGYPGKCASMHGHTWKLEVKVSGLVDLDTGLVVDFVCLKDLVNDAVIDKLDHTLLNNTIDNPTCENLLNWIWGKLSPMGGWTEKIKLERLRLRETPDSYAEMTR